MKRILSLLICLTLVFGLGVPQSFALSGSNLDANVNVQANGQITVSGVSSKAASDVSLRIFDPSGTCVHLDQVKAGSDKTFKFTFRVNDMWESGTYIGKINENGAVAQVTWKWQDDGSGSGGEGNTGGDTGGGDGGTTVPKEKTVSISIKGPSSYILSRRTVAVESGDTVMDVTRRVMDDNGISYYIRNGEYIVEIDGLGEFDKGPKSGWMYKVNGSFPNVGAAAKDATGGMNIQWVYTTDYTKEPGNKFDDSTTADGPGGGAGGGPAGIPSDGTAAETAKSLEEKLNEDLKPSDVNEYAKAVSNGLEKLVAESESMEVKEVAAALETLTSMTNKLIEAASGKRTAFMVTESILENYKQVDELAASAEEKQFVSQKIQDIAETLLSKSTLIEVDSSAVVNENGKTVAKIDEAINALNLTVENDVKKINSLMRNNSLKLQRKLTPTMTVKVPAEADAISIQISEETRKALENTAVQTLRIQTENANVCVDQSMLSSSEGDIELTVREVTALSEDVEKAASAALPEKTFGKILDFQLNVGQEKQDAFSEPMEIEIPIAGKIKDGEQLSVYYLAPDGTKEIIGGYYDADGQVMRFKTNHFSMFYVDYADVSFKDMKEHELNDEVQLAVARGILNGRGDGSFDPDSNLTRAEFAQILCNMLKPGTTPEETLFHDINEDDWFAEGVATAYEMGWITGRSDDVFDPYGTLTRQEIAVVIGKVLEHHGYEMAEYTVMMGYPDFKTIEPWAVKGMSTAVHYGMIREGDDGGLNPDTQVSRAELAEMLNRLYTLIYR